jgi:hypothetical protein
VSVAAYGPQDRVTNGGTKRHPGESSENSCPMRRSGGCRLR